MPFDISGLSSVGACVNCKVPIGLVPYIELVLWIDLFNGVTPDPNQLDSYIRRASCYFCLLTGNTVPAAKVAILLAIINGDNLDTTPQGLLNASACLLCYTGLVLRQMFLAGLIQLIRSGQFISTGDIRITDDGGVRVTDDGSFRVPDFS